MTGYQQPLIGVYWKLPLRGLVSVLVVVPILLLALITPDQIQNFYWLMLVAGLIPLTTAAYLLFGISDQACLGLGLYDKTELS